MIIKILII